MNNPCYGGGGAIAVHEIAKRLAKNHEVTVITGSYPKCKNLFKDGVNYKRIGFHLLGPRLSQLIYQFLLPFQLKDDFDVWIESFTPPFSSAFLPFFTSKPIVGLTQLLGGKAMTNKYKIPFTKIEDLALKHYTNLIAITPELKKTLLIKSPRAEVKLIPNGFTRDEYLNKDNLERKHILYIGRFDIHQKGIDLLLESYKKVASSIAYPMLLAGHGSQQEVNYIKRLIHEYKLNSKVKIVGHARNSKKEKLFKEAVVTVIPSRFESFGIVVLEAFHYKSPVICFDIDGFAWIPTNLATKIMPYDTAMFGQEMERLTSIKLRSQNILDAYNFSKKYSWETSAKEYEKYLISIVSGSNKI
jgi:glycosyltransferase involved in cell wall biosynthesis